MNTQDNDNRPATYSADQRGSAQQKQGLTAENGRPAQHVPASLAPAVDAGVMLGPNVRVVMPALYHREVYAGICHDPGLGPLHLILLPGDVRVSSIEDADEFVDSVGGDLPTYAELQHLHEHVAHLFKPGLYYSCDQEEYDGEMATAIFDFAHQVAPGERDEPRQVRARAVRRVLADAASAPAGGLSAQQVAALAERLIDQHAVADGEESIERARMVSTGIMVGVRLLATEVQKALAACARQPDGGLQ